MKKILLSASLLISVFGFSQTTNCVVDIKSNQGGGNCPPCPIPGTGFVPNEPGFMSQNPTGTVTITFANLQTLCGGNLPRLVSVKDVQGNFIRVKCGQGRKPSGNFPNSVEFCLFDEAINTEAGNPDNFFNQPDLVVRIVCPGTTDTLTVSKAFCVGQAPLPVKFKSISASRSKNNVAVKWQTAQEQNNKGFHVQRKTKGEWENVAFVLSLANGGNSSSDLSYSFNDMNTEKGISQYRVMQVDLDGRSSVSEIRSVRGEEMAASKMVVFPNPSLDGKVSVVFEEGNGNRNVVVSDMSGRRVKQYRNVSSNNLIIEGLENGVYSIQVTDLTSSALSVEKVIVKKR
jgi:hypothetical protein